MLCVHWLLFACLLGAHGIENDVNLDARLALTLGPPEGLPLHAPPESVTSDPPSHNENIAFFKPAASSQRTSRQDEGFGDSGYESSVYAPTQQTWPNGILLPNDVYGSHYSIPYTISPTTKPAREHQPPIHSYSVPYDTIDPAQRPVTPHQPLTRIAAASGEEPSPELGSLPTTGGQESIQPRQKRQKTGIITRTVRPTSEPPNETCTTLPGETAEIYAWIGAIGPRLTPKLSYRLDLSFFSTLRWSQRMLLEEEESASLWVASLQKDHFKPQTSRHQKIFDLCIKVATINSRFVRLFGIDLQDPIYAQEQSHLQEWLVHSIFVSNIVLPRTHSINIPPDLKPLPDHVKHLIENFLHLRESPNIWVVRGRGQARTTIEKVTVVITKPAVHILWTYYKTMEGKKWQTLFPDNIGFLQVLASIKAKVHTGTFNQFSERVLIKLKGHPVFPWRSPMDPASANTLKNVFLHEKQHFASYYIKNHLLPYKGP